MKTMQHYIEQLIDDLAEAKKHVPPEPVFSEDYDEFEKQMLAIETAPDVPAKKLYGISYEELPPPERLTEKQMQQLIEAIADTWAAFNCFIIFPDNVPIKLQYELIREQFAEPIHYMPGWSNNYDFCSGWCPDCEIAEYCTNKDDIWTSEELEEERKKSTKKR